jgi:integrase
MMMSAALDAVDHSSAAACATDSPFTPDIWDIRTIPGVRYLDHESLRWLNFTHIPAPFRPLVKRYFQLGLTRWTVATCEHYLYQLQLFLRFFAMRYPQTTTFIDLTVADIEAYVQYLHATPCKHKSTRNAKQMRLAFTVLEAFLRYVQRIDSPLAPRRPIEQLIWPEHRGRHPIYAPTQVRYLSERVLQQLDQHMHQLPPAYLPVIIILRASGWRISDVLNLRHDTCLEHTERGWSLCGDILKTQVFNHRVPITDEVAAIVRTQCQWVREHYSDASNPKRYLFPAYTPARAGRPLSGANVTRVLNTLAFTYRIRDDDGQIMHFKTHAFRHTKAVELLNNGMPLALVQKWMAHLSPEMTLIYAKVLDTTMREQWDQAMARGAVRITVDGSPEVVDPETLVQDDELALEHVRPTLDARRLQNGYCFKHRKFDCPAAHIPCYRCPMFVTTPAFLPQFAHERQDTIELIAIGEAAGRPHWVEANRRKLETLEQILATLEQGHLHQPMGKAKREYTGADRAEPTVKGGEEEKP